MYCCLALGQTLSQAQVNRIRLNCKLDQNFIFLALEPTLLHSQVNGIRLNCKLDQNFIFNIVDLKFPVKCTVNAVGSSTLFLTP